MHFAKGCIRVIHDNVTLECSNRYAYEACKASKGKRVRRLHTFLKGGSVAEEGAEGQNEERARSGTCTMADVGRGA